MSKDNIVNLNEERVPTFVFEDDTWQDNFEEKDAFLKLVNPINYEFETNPETTQVVTKPISCFKDSLILRVTDTSWKEDWAIFYFLYSNGKYFQLGSINEKLFTINNDSNFYLNKRTIIDYLKLAGYFYIMDNDLGSHFVVESPESEFADFLMFSNEMERQRNLDKIDAPKIEGPDQNGIFSVEVCMIIGSNLVKYYILVDDKGGVEFKGFLDLIGTYESDMNEGFFFFDDNDDDVDRV